MRIASLALVAAALTTGVFACGGQVVDGPSVPPQPPTPPTTPTTPVQPPTTPPEPPSSPIATTGPAAPNTCLSLMDSGSALTIVSIDLKTGVVTEGAPLQPPPGMGYHPSSIGVVDADILFCDDSNHEIVKVARADGSVTSIKRSCTAVAADGNGIYVMNLPGAIEHFPDLASLSDKSFKGKSLGELYASRLGTSNNGLLAAWHSANEVLRLDGKIALEGYDDWIFGLSGAPGSTIIVSSPRAKNDKPGLLAFDALTGKNLGAVATLPAGSFGLGFNGLSCGE